MNGNTADPYYDFYSCATTAEKVNGVTYQKIAGVDCWYECNFSGSIDCDSCESPAETHHQAAQAEGRYPQNIS